MRPRAPQPKPAPSRNSRWPLLLLGLVLLAVLLLSLLRHLLEPQRLSDFLLRQAGEATGLAFELDSPADVSLWPDLHLVLNGLSVRAPGHEAMLRVARVELALPWSTLWNEQLHLQQLRLQEPVLDRDLLSAHLASIETPGDGPPAPLQLPRIDTALVVRNGSVVGSDPAAWQLREIGLQIDGIADGERMQAALEGRYLQGELDLSFELDVDAPLAVGSDGISLEPLRIVWTARDPRSSNVELLGNLRLDPPLLLAFDFETELLQWPDAWPAPPLVVPDAPVATLTLSYLGTPQLDGRLEFTASHGDAAANGHLQTAELLEWMAMPEPPPLPPLTLNVLAPTLSSEDVVLQGVELSITPAGRKAAARLEQAEADGS